MQKNRFMHSIAPNVRLICLILLISSTLLAKSLYLALFITTFVFVMIVLSGKEVKVYVKFIKNIAILLVIFLAFYIILFRGYNILDIIIAIYKSVLVSLMVKVFEISINFRDLHSSIYGLLLPFKKFDILKLSYNSSMSLYFIKYLLKAKGEVIKLQRLNGKMSFGIKKYFGARLIFAINKVSRFEEELKINHYSLRYNKSNFKSKFVLFVFVTFFVVCIFKEVVL